MSKFLHEHAGSGCGTSAAELGIVWPSLPWTCPRCGQRFERHDRTIATLGVFRYDSPESATFLCAGCDLATFHEST